MPYGVWCLECVFKPRMYAGELFAPNVFFKPRMNTNLHECLAGGLCASNVVLKATNGTN